MATFVCNSAMLQCSFGAAPAPLTVLPDKQVMGAGGPMASIMDFKPFANISPFAMCSSPSNPMVAAATVAAFGVLTPQPCIPATIAPWVTGAPTVQTKTLAALDNTSKCMCMWGGSIQVVTPGQFTVQIP